MEMVGTDWEKGNLIRIALQKKTILLAAVEPTTGRGEEKMKGQKNCICWKDQGRFHRGGGAQVET